MICLFDLGLSPICLEPTIANPNFGFQKQLFDFEVNGGVQKVSIICPRVKDASFGLFFCDKVW